MYDNVAVLLEAHGLAGCAEAAFEHTGFSGASLTRLVRDDGQAFVLKRMSIARDWIMQETDDHGCREAAFADASVELGDRVRTPAVGASRDGDAHAVLMQDIGDELLAPGAITQDQLHTIIDAMAALHRLHTPREVPWCDLTRRLTLLTPDTARVAMAYGAPVARDIIAGWARFDELATPEARAIVHGLFADPAPLVRALERTPAAFLHGDLKFDNIGIDRERRIWLIDWAMTLVAPPAVELGWFMAINSRRLPPSESLDTVMARYADAAGLAGDARTKHDGLTALCGLLLRGWRKALDAAEGDGAELAWWCDRADAARWLLA